MISIYGWALCAKRYLIATRGGYFRRSLDQGVSERFGRIILPHLDIIQTPAYMHTVYEVAMHNRIHD